MTAADPFPPRFIAICNKDPARPRQSLVHVKSGWAWATDGHRAYGLRVNLVDGVYAPSGGHVDSVPDVRIVSVASAAAAALKHALWVVPEGVTRALESVATYWPNATARWHASAGNIAIVAKPLSRAAEKRAERQHIKKPPPALIRDAVPLLANADFGLDVNYALDALYWTGGVTIEQVHARRFQSSEPIVFTSATGDHVAVVMPVRL